MPRIACPTCGAALDITPDMIGETVECSSCQAYFVAMADKTPSQWAGSDEDRPGRPRDQGNYTDGYRPPRRPRPANAMAVTSMILGVGAMALAFGQLVSCTGIFAPVLSVFAIVMGIIGLRSGIRRQTMAGITLGVAAFAVLALILIVS